MRNMKSAGTEVAFLLLKMIICHQRYETVMGMETLVHTFLIFNIDSKRKRKREKGG
ncbi:MAG TPA: hypothetical protein PKA28_18695 [Methylomusa anaerophila]|uniref:Uncharacterized protein n=1 Tax=Methylomusa anaerophila TaxID=1930071 RepID=A0A348AE91_9FIRM|nr:hypothetical protein [Methylomusa anaerophila]BBB89389.1 hypothetical protein MAMMFC1_00022 [Methylomusa anaerophila]HML90467.1 hypothetical protein [Methylomusa anaerophila]